MPETLRRHTLSRFLFFEVWEPPRHRFHRLTQCKPGEYCKKAGCQLVKRTRLVRACVHSS